MQKLFLSLVLGLLAPLALAGHHLNGTWKLNVDLGGQGGVATFTLAEAEGGVLSGTYSGAAGTAAVTGKVSGADVEFSFDAQGIKVSYMGKYADGKLMGKCSYGEMGTGTFEGSKAEG